MSNITFNDMGSSYNVTMEFSNGYELSITKGRHAYSGTNSAEIAVLKDGKFVRIEGQGDDVIGWVSADAIASIAYRVSLVDSSGNLDSVRDSVDAHSLGRLRDLDREFMSNADACKREDEQS